MIGEQAFSGTRIIIPTRAVHGSLDLDLGGRVLRLTAHPTAHTDNDLTVLDLETRTFWPGDLLFVRHIPVVDGSLTGWLEVLNGLLARDFARVVPGHGPPLLPWPDVARDQLRYLTALAGAEVGTPAPDWTLDDLDANTWTMSGLAGKVVFLAMVGFS